MNQKPNILIIMADQQRYDTIAKAGYPHMITPNLDKLCEEGCLFTHAHTHNPVCMPARHDLLIGMPACSHGYFNNAESQTIADYGIPTLPRIFSDHGYRTASVGKMHFHPVRAHHGYNEMYTMEELPRCPQNDDFAMHLRENGQGDVQNLHGVRPLVYHTPQKALVRDENYETKWVGETAINWLVRNEDNPFFLFVGYIKPHPPWDIPESQAGKYKDANLPPVIERARCYPEKTEANPWYGDMDTPEQLRKNREAYFTACTLVDESVGEIIEHLRQTGQLDNTMVIYTSDHGEMLGDKGYYSKNVPYESSVRVPLIVRYPEKMKADSTNEALVDLMDIFPTCIEMAKLPYPKSKYQLYGDSLFQIEAGKTRDVIISANGFLNEGRWVMARSKDYKYIYRYNCGFEEWYDLRKDPQELTNCIEEMRHTKEYQALYQAMVSYEEKYGPEGAVQDGKICVFEGKEHEGHENGKYHLWANKQFQTFLNENQEEFGEKFVAEIKEALSNYEISGCSLNDVFQDPRWKETFAQGFAQVGTYKNWEAELFQEDV